MCIKSLIILLLGCALSLAIPIQENGNLSPQSENNVDIGSWLNKVHYEIRKSFKHTVQPFARLYDVLVEASNVPQYSKEKIEELRILFDEIMDKSRENLSDIENVVLTSTIKNLQRAVEFLSRKPNQNIQTGQHVLHKGNQNLQGIINNQANNAKKCGHTVWSGLSGLGQSANNVGQKVQGMVDNQLENVKDSGFYYEPGKVSITDKLGGGVHDVYEIGFEETKKEENEKKKKVAIDEDAGFFNNLGNTVKRTVNSGAENVKNNLDDWGNNWTEGLKTGQDLFNSFGDKAQETFNNGKNAIGSGVKNVQGNLNEWGNNGYELTQGFSNIVNQAKDTFGDGFNGLQNQLNQYFPGNNNLGGGYHGTGNLFDSKQTLSILEKQLAQAIDIQMSEIEKNLYKWKDFVESFLSNSASNVEKQPRKFHESINIPGSIGFMPSIDEGIEIPKNPIEGIFGNMGKKVGETVVSGVDQFTGGFMPNIDKGIEIPKNPIEGIFGNLGKKVGETVVSGVDQFTGGFVPNIDAVKENLNNSDKGIFSKIGKKVGGDMGNGLDKFTGTVGGFFNNAGKIFG